MQRMPSPPRGESVGKRFNRRLKMDNLDALAEAMQHDEIRKPMQRSCTHTPSMPPARCWCGALEHTVVRPDA